MVEVVTAVPALNYFSTGRTVLLDCLPIMQICYDMIQTWVEYLASGILIMGLEFANRLHSMET